MTEVICRCWNPTLPPRTNHSAGTSSHQRWRGGICFALFIAARLSVPAQSEVDSQADRETNATTTTATFVQTDSLQRAWTEAIASAHRLKASHKSTEAARETFSATKATR